MVGLLNAPKNTKLYNRLKNENRLTTEATGNNTDFSMNFMPKMNYDELMKGYKKIINNIYSAKPFNKRIRRFLNNYRKYNKNQKKVEFPYLMAFLKSIFIIGILDRGRTEYWKTFIWTLFKHPGLFLDAMTYSVYGYHYRKVFAINK